MPTDLLNYVTMTSFIFFFLLKSRVFEVPNLYRVVSGGQVFSSTVPVKCINGFFVTWQTSLLEVLKKDEILFFAF